MKAKVLITFYDSVAKVVRNVGDIIEVTPSRFNEIRCKGRFVEAHDETAQKAATTEKK